MSNGALSKARLDRMHDVMAGHVERGALPGLVTLVSRHGEVRVDTIGTTAVAPAAPSAPSTVLRLSSAMPQILKDFHEQRKTSARPTSHKP